MKKLNIIALLLFITSSNFAVAKTNESPGKGMSGKVTAMHKVFCEQLKCGSDEVPYTSKKCVDFFDKYFDESGGKIPTCIPKWPTDEFLANEILCYANRKVLTVEECDPLFDPDIDEYGVIGDNEEATPYQVCLMDMSAMFDLCRVHMALPLFWSECYQQFIQPCYDEYYITGDNETLNVCLQAVQWEVDICTEEIFEKFYFWPDYEY